MSHCDKDRRDPADTMAQWSCCADWEIARAKRGCTPHVSYLPTYCGEPLGFFIEACDGDLSSIPLSFCPWCGTKLPTFEVHDENETQAEAAPETDGTA